MFIHRTQAHLVFGYKFLLCNLHTRMVLLEAHAQPVRTSPAAPSLFAPGWGALTPGTEAGLPGCLGRQLSRPQHRMPCPAGKVNGVCIEENRYSTDDVRMSQAPGQSICHDRLLVVRLSLYRAKIRQTYSTTVLSSMGIFHCLTCD